MTLPVTFAPLLDQVESLFALHTNPKVHKKAGHELVTDLDLILSQEIQKFSTARNIHLLSEEEDDKQLQYPMLILDPIDGTKEFVRGLPEYALSLAYMDSPFFSSPKNWGWIYNPVLAKFNIPCRTPGKLLGFVSRSEWDDGLYANFNSSAIELRPVGSIAFKLSLLAGNYCDFVITLKDKNLWDIAGGTIECHQQNFKLFHKTKQMESFNTIRYTAPMTWCRAELFSTIADFFKL
ncbi:MAG: hypothetical protein A2X86_05395 [Bdellovibrionales bacterium GWA2_49_15]|nr:MAG: hypothetical protein A2X86_05395 [Bdellovibrionales bacterium GWA2_49_15]